MPIAVGVPKDEGLLTDALTRQAPAILPPRGGVLVQIREVELGTGRPDAILAIVDRDVIDCRRSTGMRLPRVAHARQLQCLKEGKASPYSESYERRLFWSLRDRGWLNQSGEVFLVRAIHRSLLIEAKVSDWYRGIGQLVRGRWATNEAALLVPSRIAHRVRRKTLDHNGLGMITANESFDLGWQVRPATHTPTLAADAWLTELIIRAMESADTERTMLRP